MPLPNTKITGGQDLMDSLEICGFFPDTVDIRQHDGTQNDMNEPDLADGNFDTVTGLGAVPCRITPIRAREVRQESFEEKVATHQVLLDAYYSQITDQMVAIIGGVRYNIVEPNRDGSSTFTRLDLELVQT